MNVLLEASRKDVGSLKRCIDGLEALLQVLAERHEEDEADWISSFRAHWETLEEMYAFAVAESQDVEAVLNDPQVVSAIQEMKRILVRAMA